MAKMIIDNAGTDEQKLTFHSVYDRVDFRSKDSRGIVEVNLCIDDHKSFFYINQPQLKALIEHLQKQLV